MDIDNLKEILLSISTEEKQALIQSVQLIEEIQSSIVGFFTIACFIYCFIYLDIIETNNNNTAYSHLILREKYFILIQNIIETKHELMVKFVFRLLQVCINYFCYFYLIYLFSNFSIRNFVQMNLNVAVALKKKNLNLCSILFDIYSILILIMK